MKQAILGMLAGLVFAGVGVYWWTGNAQVQETAPPPPEAEETRAPEDELPVVDPGDLRGPAPPAQTELTREEKRFFRYDRNRDRQITRNEMLSTRSNAFRKLDVDGNNLLTFEEWAVSTAQKFDSADANRNGKLTPAEFATTAPKRRPGKPRCRC